MKILLANDSAAELGGAQIMTFSIRDELRARGHDVRLFAAADHPEYSADTVCYGSRGHIQTLSRTANPSAYRQLHRLLEEFQPDVVHVRMFLMQLSPLILPLLRDVPSIYHAVMYESVCPTGSKLLPDHTRCRSPAGRVCHTNGCLSKKAWVPLMLQRRLWRRWRNVFDRVIANSSAIRDELVAEDIGPVEVLANGVPVTPQGPPLTPTPTAVFAGRLGREKGVDVLVRAFTEVVETVPDARLLIAGDGFERERIRAAVPPGWEGDRVTFLGKIPHAELDARFGGAWVQAVPSLWEEPFGIVAAEALMRGTAVVASDAGGLREIVLEGKTGYLVPPGDVHALTRALVALLENRERAEQMGRLAREDALARFTISTMVDRLLSVYGEVRAMTAANGRRG